MAKVHKIVGVPDEESDRPSKSQKKRESAEINKFAQRLAELNAKQIKLLKLPEEIEEALLKAITMKADGARKRQINLIGGLIRIREDSAEILACLDR